VSIARGMTRRNRPLPGAARELIDDSVHSVGVLDLLLLVRGDPERWWALEEVAVALHCPVGWASLELKRLRSSGLVEMDADRRYSFRPHSARLAGAVDALAEAYSAHTPEIVRLIFSADSPRARAGDRSRARHRSRRAH
jgi:hypothetical protein